MSNIKRVSINLPPQLRQFVSDKDTVQIECAGGRPTLRHALCALPLEIQRRIFQTDLEAPDICTESVRRTLLVFVGDQDHRFLDGELDREIEDDSEISIVPANAGG